MSDRNTGQAPPDPGWEAAIARYAVGPEGAEKSPGVVPAAERTNGLSPDVVLELASRLESTFDPGGNLPDDCEEWGELHIDVIQELRGLAECALMNDDEDFSPMDGAEADAAPVPPLERDLSDFELDQRSIRTGCETEGNRRADAELKRRGLIFDATEQRWIHPACRTSPAPQKRVQAAPVPPAPPLRDNGKPNRPHEFELDPETSCCVICGWAEAVHNWAEADAAPVPPPPLEKELAGETLQNPIEHGDLSQMRASPVADDSALHGLPQVAGRLDRTLAQVEHSCLVLLREEQEQPNPDNALIATLCDAVRMKREYVTALAAPKQIHSQAAPVPPAPPCEALVDLIRRVVTGDGAQLENLDMTEDEWNEGAGILEDGEAIEITISRADWFDLIRAAGGTVLPSALPPAPDPEAP